MRNENEFIERRIITGLIISTDYHERIQRFWNSNLLESPEIKQVANWCVNYFQKYKKAPDKDIESIYMEQLRIGKLHKADALYIEELLSDLNNEYGRDTQFNSAYLNDQTIKYFKSQELERHNRDVQSLIDMGKVEEAERLTQSYTPTILDDKDTGLELSSKEAMKRIGRAFNQTSQRVITYPGKIGEMWNEHLTRGSFFTFLAPEKRGKSFMLMDMALRAVRQRAHVAFFEAGDSTESQFLKRVCIHISRRNDKAEYCQERYRSVGDCVYNQLDTCNSNARNCDHGIFEDIDIETFNSAINEYVNMDSLREKYENNPDYEPCKAYGCTRRKGTVWLEKVKAVRPLTAKQAKREVRRFFRKYKRRFILGDSPAGILTVSEIEDCLDKWEKRSGFVPDVIVIDYADLLSAEDGGTNEFRHKQNHIWQKLRALSKERHVLLLTATQADKDSYKKDKLSLHNFSEDKRKLSHTTSQFGLNQDVSGREKRLGIMRINPIVVREGEFYPDNEVHVLQDLAIGRAFLESY